MFSKRVMVLGLFCLMIFAATNVAASIAEDFVLVAENAQLKLYARASDGQLIIEDIGSELIWRSNPEPKDISGFMMLSDLWQGNLQSPVYLDYFDKRRNVRGANVYSQGVEIDFEAISNGFVCSYFFPQTEIKFTVVYTLEDDCLVVQVPWDKMQIGNDELQLLSLQLLPFLGAQPSAYDLSGYMFVPDGSGGLMQFKEMISLSATGFNQWVYGLDPAAAEPSYDPYREPVVIPVYGMKAGQQAFVGIIEQGQEAAKVLATPDGVITNFNRITSELWYSQSIVMRTSRTGSGIRIFDENPIPGDRSVRFYFLTEVEADYVGMAQVYREYLIKHQNATRLDIKQWPAPIMIELLGADYETNIFGPVIQSMTTFAEAKAIVDSLQASGIDELVVAFRGWNRLGANGNLPRRLPAEKVLGGDSGLTDLADYLGQQDIPLVLVDEYTIARGTSNGFQASTQASRTTYNDLIRVYEHSYSGANVDVESYLISPPFSLTYAKRDLPKMRAYGAQGITHLSLGEYLNSDHNPDGEHKIQRLDCKQIYQDLLQYTRDNFTLVGATTGNAYVLGLVDYLTHVPMQSTRDTYIDQSIPFFQIATHGLVTNYTAPINFSINPSRDLLRAIEYGVLPYFTLTAEPSWKLRYTLSSDMYSTQYQDWLPDVIKYYQTVNENLYLVADQFIVEHQQLANNVYLTSYENGITFVVNYGQAPFSYRGIEIASESFAVFGEEGLL